MSFDRHQRGLTQLGQRMLDEAQGHNWEGVASLHRQLQERLVSLFQSDELPGDGRPAQLLSHLQAVSESVAKQASGERDHCRDSLAQMRLRQQAKMAYDNCHRP